MMRSLGLVAIVLLSCLAACDAAGERAPAPPDLSEPEHMDDADASTPGPDSSVDSGSSDRNVIDAAPGSEWSISPKFFGSVKAVVAHPTDAKTLGLVVLDHDTHKLRFALSTNLATTFSRYYGICAGTNEGDPVLERAGWSRTDPDVIAVLADVDWTAVGGNPEVYVSTTGGKGFGAYKPEPDNPYIKRGITALDVAGSFVAVRKELPESGSTPNKSILYFIDPRIPTFPPPPPSYATFDACRGGPSGAPEARKQFAVKPDAMNGAMNEVLIECHGVALERCIRADDSRFSCIVSSVPSGIEGVDRIEYSPHDGNRVLAVGRRATGGKAVLLSTDGGSTFVETLQGGEQIAFDPRTGSLHAFALGQGKVHRSVDGGKTWSDVTPSQAIEPTSLSVHVYAIAARADGGLVALGSFRLYFLAPLPL